MLRSKRVALVLTLSLVVVVFPTTPGFALEVEAPETVVAEHEGLPESDEGVGVLADSVRTTPVVEAEIPFNMIGFHLPDGVDSILVRTAKRGGDWSGWHELGVLEEGLDGPDVGSEEAREATPNGTDPLWVGEADLFQVRVDSADPGDVKATVIDTTGLSEPFIKKVGRYLVPRQSSAEASVSRPNIVTRADWKADEDLRKGDPSYTSTIDHVIVHHTANSNSYTREQGPALVRSIYHWHTQGNGWNDIGYNMLVDRYGVVYEGRYGGVDRAVIGAHAAGFNSGSFGISVIGNFDVADIPTSAYRSLVQTISWKMRLHGMNMNPDRTFTKNNRTVHNISGHRDVGWTACPGRYLYQRLSSLRAEVATAGMPSSGGTPVVGDWNGDGKDTPGIFADGTFYLRNSNTGTNPYPDLVVPFGRAGDRPIVGDWNRDGRTGLGVVRDGTWLLRDTATPGSPTRSFVFGRVVAGDRPIVGDWNRDGRDTVGIVRSGGEWHQRDSLTAGNADRMFVFGRVAGGDFPVTGDWSGDGRSTVGIVRDDTWMLRDHNSAGFASREIRFGRPGDFPIVGDWNGDGKQTIGVVRDRTWYLNDGIRDGYAQMQFRF